VAAASPAPLAYVFFHAPAPEQAPATYEAALAAFHTSLHDAAPDGFVGSASYRCSRLPWAPHPFGAVVYADWYFLRDWASLGTLNREAVRPPHRAPHDVVAGRSEHGAGGLYALRAGAPEPDRLRFELWSSKPAGVPSAEYIARVHDATATSTWQRQLALGPAPEFCRRSLTRPTAASEGLIVEVRPVFARLRA